MSNEQSGSVPKKTSALMTEGRRAASGREVCADYFFFPGTELVAGVGSVVVVFLFLGTVTSKLR